MLLAVSRSDAMGGRERDRRGKGQTQTKTPLSVKEIDRLAVKHAHTPITKIPINIVAARTQQQNNTVLDYGFIKKKK